MPQSRQSQHTPRLVEPRQSKQDSDTTVPGLGVQIHLCLHISATSIPQPSVPSEGDPALPVSERWMHRNLDSFHTEAPTNKQALGFVTLLPDESFGPPTENHLPVGELRSHENNNVVTLLLV